MDVLAEIKGSVVHGKKKGRTMDFPTANIGYDEAISLPPSGVYASYVLLRGKRYKGITNIGPRPTFGEEDVTIETHIIDFSGNIYGMKITVYLISYLRPTVRFNSIDELKEALAEDRRKAIALLC